jgi:predicted dehydrogenase
MRIAIVGTGYVADFYLKTLPNHPQLELLGVMDRDLPRAGRFAAHHGVPTYPTLQAVLDDPRVELVANLTNPSSHYEVSKAALQAGKHVYSEKPLSMDFDEAVELVELAEKRNRHLGGAPCSILGETAQTLWKAIRRGDVGTPRLVYAELDDGPIHRMGFQDWKSESGNPWPWQDELEVGCTLEHAGYYVTWLVAFFGPAVSVTSFSSVVVPDKFPPGHHEAGSASPVIDTPDFSVACITFASGVVARITCSIFAPHDHRLRIIGDDGVLSIDDCWNYGSPVHLQRRTKLRLKAEKYPRAAKLAGLGPEQVPLVRTPKFAWKTKGANPMDFARGIAEMAAAIRAQTPGRMSARYALHVNEIVLAIQSPQAMGTPRKLVTTCEPMSPMPWAE